MKNVFHVFLRVFTKFFGEHPSKLVISLCVALLAAPTAFAEEYITDVMVIGGDATATNSIISNYGQKGWTFIGQNLNADAGGDYIYILYKKSSGENAGNGFITDFIIRTSDDQDFSFNGRTYIRANSIGSGDFMTSYGNLNSGTTESSSTKMWLYYTKEEFPDRRVVSDIAITTGLDNKIKTGYTTLGKNGAVVGSYGSGAMDLNEGAGSDSKYIFMHFATVSSSTNTTQYISDVVVLGGSEKEVNALKERYSSQGWVVVRQDLNAGSGSESDFIYMAYKRSPFSDVDKGFITDFFIKTGNKHPVSTTYKGRMYYRAPSFGSNDFETSGGNLNSNTKEGCTNMWLYFTRESFPDKRVVSNIAFTSGKANKTKEGYTTLGENGAVVGNDGFGAMDLNDGADGDYIYMHFATAPKVNITFVTGLENISVPMQTVVSGSTPTKPTDLEREGYQFMGWFTTADGNTQFDFSAPITNDVSVYARWGRIVTFVTGDANVVVPSQTVFVGDAPTKPSDPERTGLRFAGWFADESFSTEFDFSAPVTKNTTAYAKWEASVTFVTSLNNVSVPTQTIIFGNTPTKPNDPVYSGLKFAGWFADEAFTTEFDFSAPVTSNTTAYAKWEASVTFATGDENVSVPTQTVVLGNTPTKPTDPERTGFKFMGWYTTADANTQFDFSAPVTSNTIVYARWGHIVTFVTGDANVVVPTQSVFVGDAPTKPSDPERTGLRFAGWFADESFSTEFDFSAPVTSNTTAYAKWEASVMFVTGDENVSVPTQTIVYGNTPTKPDDPERIGLKFAGWFADESFTIEFDFSAPITSNTTAYAKWVASVMFATGDENVSVPTQTIVYGYTPTKPADPKRTGFKFLGWYTTADGNTEFDFDARLNGNAIAYAKWGVPYIDEKGVEQLKQPGEYTVLTTSTDVSTLSSGWYVAVGDVEYSTQMKSTGDLNIILANGANLTVNGSDVGLSARNVAIYRQKNLTGMLTVNGIDVNKNIAINGGTVLVTGNVGIRANSGNIVLGWSHIEDRVTVSCYPSDEGKVMVASGQAFKDKNGNVYFGELTAAQISAIAGKTLEPCYSVSFDSQNVFNALSVPTVFDENGVAHVSIPDINPSRNGLKFIGWYTSANGNIKFDFDAPVTSNTTVFANWRVPYIDENGEEQVKQPGEYTLLTNMTDVSDLPGGWYVFVGDIFAGDIFAYDMTSTGDLNIIITDGTILNLIGLYDCGLKAKNIVIYGQNNQDYYNQKGHLIVRAYGGDYAIIAEENLTINGGGFIELEGPNGIKADNVTLNGKGTSIITYLYGGIGINSRGDVKINVNGGDVETLPGPFIGDVKEGIYTSEGDIILSGFWSEDTEILGYSSGRIQISSYRCPKGKVKIVEGDIFKDDDYNLYYGELTAKQISDIAGKSLEYDPYGYNYDTLTFVTGVENIVIPMQLVYYVNSPKKPDDPERIGYKFLGWFTTADGNTEFDFDARLNGNAIAYAKWGGIVTFVTGDENLSVPAQTVVVGNTPTKPRDLERTGFKFLGWYADDAFTTVYDFSAPVTNDVSVYARWWKGIVTDLSTLTGHHVAENGELLMGTLGGNYKVSIADGATVTLDGVTINGVNHGAYKWAGLTCEGDCKIILKGENTVKGFLFYYPGIYVPEGKTLIIEGDGLLDASSNGRGAGIGGGDGINCGNIVINGGMVTATGGKFAAGIGIGYDASAGSIMISGGAITAMGGESAAGIGSGYEASAGSITISGGTVTATGGNDAAGIGSGYYATAGDITISGGTVTATGGNDAAGIGSGDNGSSGDITITDGVTLVTANKGESSPNSVGLGRKGRSVGKISIGGVFVDGVSTSPFTYPANDLYAYTIAFDANGGEGTMSNQKMFLGFKGPLLDNAIARSNYAFMGWNTDPNGSETVYADGASVLNLTNQAGASVTLYAQWLKTEGNVVNLKDITNDFVVQDGYLLKGTLGGKYKVSIADGATVTLDGVTINGVNGYAYQWAGLTCKGDCKIILKDENTVKGFHSDYPGIYVPEGKTLIIEGDGLLVASSNGDGAGIGGGYKIDCGNIVINGGMVTATGVRDAAGIGSGYNATVGDITITDGVTLVTVNKGESSPNSVGLGYKGKSVGKISIGGVFVDGISESPYTFQTYDVVFNANGGTGSMEKQRFVYNANPTALSKNIFTRDGLVFAGWNTKADGSGTAYADGAKVQNLTDEAGGKVTLYAQWNKITNTFAAITISKDKDEKLHATIDGSYSGTAAVSLDDEIDVADVELDRTFSTVGYATITLPFDIDSVKVKGAMQFLKFVGVILNENTGFREVHFERAWCDLPALLAEIDKLDDLSDKEKKEKKEKVEAKCNAVPKKLFAYTPYVVQMKAEMLTFDDGVTLVKTPATVDTVVGNWKFKGTLAPKTWEEGDPEIGNAYGYVAGTGEFKKVGDKSSIGALRSYLVYEKQPSGTQSSANVPAGASTIRANFSTEFLPANMDVVIVDDDENGKEHRTVIGKFNTHTGEFKFTLPENGTFDVKGRRVNETRSVGKGRKAKGVYYGRGR